MRSIRILQLVSAMLLLPGMAVAQGVGHPFLLWTKDEAAAIRQRIETDPMAKRQYEKMVAMETAPGRGANRTWLNLFKYGVLGDKQAGETEKRALLGFISARIPENKPGNPEVGNASWREDRTLDALRYDILYDLLTPEERAAIEENGRYVVDWCVTHPGPWRRGDPGLKLGNRMGWLPNMQWPTMAGAHVWAVALQDRNAIERIFNASGGWKWYFDHYLADDGFYMEEFGKYYSNIGAMLLWCEGLSRLGLDQYGWGYTGQGGATMRQFLRMLIRTGYPRVARDAGTPDYPSITMGDAGGAAILNGYRPADNAAEQFTGGSGEAWWMQARMNGAIQKMTQGLWWEVGYRRFPEDGYGYFLAQLRKPGEDVYLPSLYFGLGPIEPGKQTPPAAPSLVSHGRGFALLRADETPDYWESPKPAAALQFGMYYVHYVHDCFSLLQYVADNRCIYNRQGTTAGGYAGGDPWRDHVRGQASGVVVDNRQPTPVDDGERGVANERVRQRFDPLAKFVAVRAAPQPDGKALYPGVDAERALVLTDQYLFDVFALASETERQYDWHVNAPGQALGVTEAPWQDSADLDGAGFWDPRLTTDRGQPGPVLQNVRRRGVGDVAWTQTIVQRPGARPAGVRVQMLAAPGTMLYAFTPPGTVAGQAVTLMARRRATSTTFAALHEPYTGASLIAGLRRVAETGQGLAVAITGETGTGIDDRILLRTGDAVDAPLTLAGEGESFTFTGYGFLRIAADRVTAYGAVTGLRVRVAGTPRLVLNGVEVPAAVRDGMLTYAP